VKKQTSDSSTPNVAKATVSLSEDLPIATPMISNVVSTIPRPPLGVILIPAELKDWNTPLEELFSSIYPVQKALSFGDPTKVVV